MKAFFSVAQEMQKMYSGWGADLAAPLELVLNKELHMRTARVLAAASLLAVSSAGALRADFKDFSNRCTPGALRACASIQVYTSLNGSGGTNVTILVRNLQGGPFGDNTGGSVISRIGLVTPTIVGASGLTVTGINGASTIGNPGSQWLLRNPGGLGGLVELTAGLQNNGGPGGVLGCTAPWGGLPSSYFQTCNGGWVALSFTTTNAWSANSAEVAFLSTSYAVNNGGFECDTDNLPTPRPQCFDATVTPEPVTMILLGSGLASMGGVGLIRRRKGTDVTTD